MQRRGQRPRLIVRRADQLVVGDEEILEPTPVVADLHAHARQHFLLHRHPELPVGFPDTPPFQDRRVDDRQARIGIAEVEVGPAERGAPVAARGQIVLQPGSVRLQSIWKFPLPSVHGRAVTRVTIFCAGLFAT